jgi:hypothetical protein
MKLIGSMIMGLGSLVLLAGFLIWLAQFVYWLKAGIWSPVDLWRIWTELGQISLPHWRGVEKILDWILDLPASLTLMILGLLMQVIGQATMQAAEMP